MKKKTGKRETENLRSAIDEYKKLEKTFTENFGAEHEKTLGVVEILAMRYYQAGLYDEAYHKYVRLEEANRGNEASVNERHLKVKEQLIFCCIRRGDLEEFNDKLNELCESMREDLKYNSTQVWRIQSAFVDCLENEQQYEIAQSIVERNLNEVQQQDDDDNVFDVVSELKIKLAELLTKQRYYQEALRILTEVYHDYEENYGLISISTLNVKQKIGNIYSKLEDYETALEVYLDLYTNYIELYGGECSETLNIRTSIAATLLKQENYEEALNIYMAVYNSYLNLSDISNDIKVHTKHIIGHIHLKENRFYEALEIFRDVLVDYEIIYEDGYENNLNVLEAKSSIAAVLLKEKKFEESRSLYKEVFEKYRELYGETNERTIQVENILIDLDELDSMFTSDDRTLIENNVRINEQNNFGSQDFEKFILPKLTNLKPKNEKVQQDNGKAPGVDFNGKDSTDFHIGDISSSAEGTIQAANNLPGGGSNPPVYGEDFPKSSNKPCNGDTSLNRKYKNNDEMNRNPDRKKDEIDDSSGCDKDVEGDNCNQFKNNQYENEAKGIYTKNNTDVPERKKTLKETAEESMETKAETPDTQNVNKEEIGSKEATSTPSPQEETWTDITLDTTADEDEADETTDIMTDIKLQNAKKRNKKTRKGTCQCCVIS